MAIVGHTGAGKTTLTSLMMRFYEVTAGEILLDGIDLRQHDLAALRQHFAVVLQDPFLFTGTLAENIRFGNEAISDADLRRAARDVNVLDFIEGLPHQFDEPVQERGNSLSTGQKQLINFARALAFNPRILILDEATSSVDTDTELRIRGALERMVEGRTSVLIAHRLSHRAAGGDDTGDAQGPVARDGDASGATGPSRPLLEALPVAVQGPGRQGTGISRSGARTFHRDGELRLRVQRYTATS